MLKIQWFLMVKQIEYVQSLSYYGTITPLSVARNGLAATTVGNYALFGGGSPTSNVVDVYYVF